MASHMRHTVLIAYALVVTLVGCSSSNFGSSTAKNEALNAKAKASDEAPAAPDIDAVTPAPSDADPEVPVDNGGGTANASGTIADVDGGPGVLTTTQASCLRKSELYNIVIVFDASGSQAQTDPTKLRVSGAKDFLTKLSSFADANPTRKFNVSISAFASAASFGAHGWQGLNKATLADLNTDIDTVTAKTAAGTNYLAALTAADQLLVKQNASVTDKAARNFVIFMTDGEPNGSGSLTQINSATAALASVRGAAMIMLGTGTGVSTKGETVLQGMALPNPGIVHPKHIGRYHRVASRDQMAMIGDILTGDVAACE